MLAINKLIKESEQVKQLKEKRQQELLLFPPIKEFLDKYEMVIDQEMLNRNFGTLNEFYVESKRGIYNLTLEIYDDNFIITYKPKEGSREHKFAQGIRSDIAFDASTRNFKGFKLSDFELGSYNGRALEFATDFVHNYRYGSKLTGMWLVGDRGIGKTTLMAGIANELHAKGTGVTFIGANQLISDLLASIKYDSRNFDKKMWNIRKAEVLIIDDIGAENPTKWNINAVLYDIFNYRMNNTLATFFTSNLTKEEWLQDVRQANVVTEQDIGRLQSRLDSLATEVGMHGEDRRKKL